MTCSKCGLRRTVEDTSAPGDCPECANRGYTVNRCEKCSVTKLEQVRSHSQAGRIMERILDLEFTMEHLAVPWNEVTAEEVKGIQILKDERESYKRELAKRPPDGFPN